MFLDMVFCFDFLGFFSIMAVFVVGFALGCYANVYIEKMRIDKQNKRIHKVALEIQKEFNLESIKIE